MKKLALVFKKHKHWFILIVVVTLSFFAALWISYDRVRPTVGRVRYEKVCDDYAKTSLPLSADTVITQQLSIPKGTELFGVRMKFTSFDETSSGMLRIELCERDGKKRTVATAELDAASLKEDHFAEFLFDKPLSKSRAVGLYALNIIFEGTSGEKGLVLWRSDGTAAGFSCSQQGGEDGTLVLQLATGIVDSGLFGAYWTVAAFAIAGVALLYVLLFIRHAKVHNIFAVAAAVFGLCFCFLTPPLCAPDEAVHYKTSYFYSSKLLGEPTLADGGMVMRECDAPAMTEERREIRDHSVWGYQEVYQNLTARPSEDDENVTVPANIALGIFPVLYVPQTLGISLARALGAGGTMTQLFGRLGNLAAYIGLVWFAIKSIPLGKTVLAVIALFPMSLQIAASMCYDALLIGIAFAFLALCFKCAYCKDRPTWQDIAALAVFAVMLAPSKGIYLPIVALALIVAPRLFKNKKNGMIVICALVAVAVVVWLAFNGQSILYEITGSRAQSTVYTDAELGALRPNGEAILNYTLGYIMARPDMAIELVVRTLQTNLPIYLQGLVGGRLGELILVNIEVNWV
ncbi:MAG: DUF2142 domain-containing protein, partial [Oscillospiraceae bacterium]